jgi:hypothetical protein
MGQLRNYVRESSNYVTVFRSLLMLSNIEAVHVSKFQKVENKEQSEHFSITSLSDSFGDTQLAFGVAMHVVGVHLMDRARLNPSQPPKRALANHTSLQCRNANGLGVLIVGDDLSSRHRPRGEDHDCPTSPST